MKWVWWGGSQPYLSTRDRQIALRKAIQGGDEECIAILEHKAVITVGRRSVSGLPSPEDLAVRGIGFAKTERGGLATYHGPGQLIAYALVDVHKRKIKVRCFVDLLEEACIRFLGLQGLKAARVGGSPGVWVSGRKVAAVGVNFSRGVSMHGLSLNLAPDLQHFGLIQPCGFSPGLITSVAELTGEVLDVEDVAPEFAGILIDCIKEATVP
jgi:lipoate-protein ligase B